MTSPGGNPYRLSTAALVSRGLYGMYRQDPARYNRAALAIASHAARVLQRGYNRYRSASRSSAIRRRLFSPPGQVHHAPPSYAMTSPASSRRSSISRRQVGQMRTKGLMGTYDVIGPKPKKDPYTLATGNDESVHNVDQAGSVAWFGYQHFKRGQVMDMVATHILKRILKRFNSNMISYYAIPECCRVDTSTAVTSPQLARIHLFFRSNNYVLTTGVEAPPSTDIILDPAQLNGKTFNEISTSLATAIVSRAKDGWKLYRIDVYRTDKSDASSPLRQFHFKLDGLDKAKVSFISRMDMKIQNVTPSDTSHMSLDAIDANPLAGVIYDFSSPTPRLQRQYVDDVTPTMPDITKMQSTEVDDGTVDMSGIRDSSGALLNQWKQPIKQSRGIFQQQRGQTPCVIKPGGFTSIPRVFTYNGRLGDFLIGLYGSPTGTTPYSGAAIPIYASTGSCTVVCLQHLMREHALSSTAVDTSVKLALNVKYSYSFSFETVKDKPMPRKLFHI